jgi:DNA-binding IclR family transcriptional regulator
MGDDVVHQVGRRLRHAPDPGPGTATVVDKGYCIAPSETTLGVIDLCAPIFDHSEGAVAALAVPYLRQRDLHVTIAAARAALLASARQISAALGAPVQRC